MPITGITATGEKASQGGVVGGIARGQTAVDLQRLLNGGQRPLSVGRTVAHVTVTLTTGAALPATLYLADGPQAQVLAVVLAPPHSTARQFTAYDAGGHQIDSARPQ